MTEGPLHVLVVEDNPGDARLLEENFRATSLEQVELEWAGRLEEGVRRMKEGEPDLVLLDLDLPDSAGLDTLRTAVRADGRFPVVVLTGLDDDETALAALREGAQDYLPKEELGPELLHRSVRYSLERFRAQRELRRQSRRFRALLENLSDLITVVGPDREVRYQSPSVERVLGYTPGEVVGRPVTELVHAEDRDAVAAALAEATEGGEARVEAARFRHADGSWRWFEALGVRPAQDSPIEGVVVTARDVTRRREAEADLRRSEARLKEAQQIAGVGDWRWDLGSGELTWSDQLYRIFGYEPGEVEPSLALFLDHLHPEDREEQERYVKEVLDEGEDYESQFRIVRGDGEVRWLWARARVERDDGEVDRLVGVTHDLTRWKEAERGRRRSEERFRALFDESPVGIAVVDAEGYPVEVNRALADMLGYEPGELKEMHFAEFTHPDDVDRDVELYGRLVEGEIEEYQIRKRYVTRPGEVIWADLNVAALRLPGEDELHQVAFARDVTEEHRAREELRRSEAGLREGQRIADMGNWEWFPEEDTGYWSDEFYRILGLEPGELEPSLEAFMDYVHPEEREGYRATLERAIEEAGSVDHQFRIVRADGEVRHLRVKGHVDRRGESSRLRLAGVLHDVTETLRRERELRESEERYRTLFQESHEAISVTTPDGEFVDVNRAWLELFGYEREEALGLDVTEIYEEPADRERLRRALESDAHVRQMEQELVDADGQVRICLLTSTVREAPDGGTQFINFLRDITERKRFERELQHRALHDSLTGLPNRSLLEDRLEQAVERSHRRGTTVAVFFVDVDRFKAINDSYGHAKGDRFLVSLGRRLEDVVRGQDTVARFGGDEFVVVAEGLEGPGIVAPTADRICGALREWGEEGGAPYHATMSVGVSVYAGEEPVPGAEDLLRRADIAMYRAKEMRGTGYRVFEPDVDSAGLGRLQEERRLREALDAEEFVPLYQPVVQLADGDAWGVELLARWDHPERGRLSAGEFIPLAEETELILGLGRQLLEAGLADTASWCENGAGFCEDGRRLLFNLSAAQFEDPALPELVEEGLERHGVPPEAVWFEVTESEVMRSTERIEPLRELGVGLVVDDFGTGYSSLGYLRDLDVDALKIDMSFVQGAVENDHDRAIVETILKLGETLGLLVVGEGIETEAQRDLLGEMGCDLGQGWLFSRPMEGGEVPGFL